MTLSHLGKRVMFHWPVAWNHVATLSFPHRSLVIAWKRKTLYFIPIFWADTVEMMERLQNGWLDLI